MVVPDSVGHLEKLEVWELSNCTKLQILPSCLMMKSLASLSLTSCSSLKKFLDFSQEMECLLQLALHSTGICELLLSFANHIGLENLLLENHLVHLSSSIYKLQHIERLSLYGDVIYFQGPGEGQTTTMQFLYVYSMNWSLEFLGFVVCQMLMLKLHLKSNILVLFF